MSVVSARDLWCGDTLGLVLARDPDGAVYVSNMENRGLALRDDVVSIDGIDDWGWLASHVAEPTMAWHGLGPSIRSSEWRFNRRWVEVLNAAGLRIFPLERDVILDHVGKPGPPHAVMYGEDLVGWIMPLLSAAPGEAVFVVEGRMAEVSP